MTGSAGSAVPGLLIAATRSGSGKTIVALGLMRALGRRGLRVVGRKNGPDYIDPAFHAAATGRPSYNLDSWCMPAGLLRTLAAPDADTTDLIICEGSMGLFDGVPAAPGASGSSADLAALTGWPVLMVHDCSGQSQSAAALLAGCADYDPRIRIAGVILNRVASERHRRLVADALRGKGLAVLGAIPRSDRLVLPERHLGLVQAGETADLDARIDAAADIVAQYVDLDALLAVTGCDLLSSRVEGARSANEGEGSTVRDDLPSSGPSGHLLPGREKAVSYEAPLRPLGQHIAVARDDAFSFLYPHVLEGWRRAGAEVSFFSPLADEAPDPGCDACWLPGGYPELYAGRLAAASRFLEGLRGMARDRPVHGECGGYMVLGRSLVDAAGTVHAMAGLLGVETSFARRRLNLGYRDALLLADTGLGPAGTRLRGHEFHYATVLSQGGDQALAEVEDAYGAVAPQAGSRRGTVTGSFFHALSEGRNFRHV